MYANCPLIWVLKIQTEIALSSTESEYIALSQALREIIPLTALMKEVRDYGINLAVNKAQIHCRLF